MYLLLIGKKSTELFLIYFAFKHLTAYSKQNRLQNDEFIVSCKQFEDYLTCIADITITSNFMKCFSCVRIEITRTMFTVRTKKNLNFMDWCHSSFTIFCHDPKKLKTFLKAIKV